MADRLVDLMLETLGTVRINYPEIFVDGESE